MPAIAYSVVDDTELSDQSFRVLFRLARFADSRGRTDTTIVQLAKDLGRDVPTVQAAFVELRDRGYVRREGDDVVITEGVMIA